MRAFAKVRPAGLLLGLLLVAFALGASSSAPMLPPRASLDGLRNEVADSSDGEIVGRWVLGELLLPGGEPARAKKARERLDTVGKATPAAGKGLFASLARLLDDEGDRRRKRFLGSSFSSPLPRV